MERRKGIVYTLAAYGLWGITPVFWKAVDDVPAVEVLAHRVLWSVPFLVAAIVLGRRRRRFVEAYRDRRSWVVAGIGGALLAVNWGVFVWAVANGHIVDASLGYFINPLVSVALGVVVLGERLRTVQWIAVGIAGIGVTGMAVILGVVPWISLALAFSFGSYGLVKKQVGAPPPLEGLLGETLVLVLPAVAFLAASGTAFGDSTGVSLLLVGAGVVTVVPLLFFGAGAQRIPLSMVGLLQYVAPTGQFLLGVLLYGETLSAPEVVGFVAVWVALALYTGDNLRAGRVVEPLEAAAALEN